MIAAAAFLFSLLSDHSLVRLFSAVVMAACTTRSQTQRFTAAASKTSILIIYAKYVMKIGANKFISKFVILFEFLSIILR